MRLLLLIPLSCLIILSISACAFMDTHEQYTETVSSWRWGNANQLFHVWGTPDKRARLSNGNRVYIYEKESFKSYPPSPVTSTINTVSIANGKSFMAVPNPGPNTISPSYLITCSTYFEVDPQNIIVDVRSKGNSCTADKNFMLSESNPNKIQQKVQHQTR